MPKSTPTSELITKIQGYENRVKEVILVAINTEAYGYDTKESFVDLLLYIMEKTAIQRLSFGSIHPWSFQEPFFKFYEKYEDSDRLVDFFHIPLQSGSDKILTLMKRGYKRAEFQEKLQRIHQLNPFAFIGTDIIAGFLEETDKDFHDTYEFLEKSPISKFHVFRFSKRNHTAAYYLSKRLKEPTPQEKHKRAQALGELSKRKYEQFLQKHVGKSFSTLLLKKKEDGMHEALLSNQIPVFIRSSELPSSQISPVKITQYYNSRLIGVMI